MVPFNLLLATFMKISLFSFSVKEIKGKQTIENNQFQ